VRPWCQYFIDARISCEGKTWRFTGIYGEPRTDQRQRTWDALRFLKAQDDLPWLCAGDFNEALLLDEQVGGNQRSIDQVQAFRDYLMDCGLTDLGFKGYKYTWSNRREGSENIHVRLDRGTAMTSFLSMFPFTQVEHVATEESDHMALVIKVSIEGADKRTQRKRSFSFEEMWTKHGDYDRMIEEAWKIRGGLVLGVQDLWGQLHEMTRTMQTWSFKTFGSIRAEIKSLRGKLDDARWAALVSGSSLEVREVEQKLHNILEKEEIMYH
jgi:hypothetical protein